MVELQEQAIRQHCKAPRMPTIGMQFARLADTATREGQCRRGRNGKDPFGDGLCVAACRHRRRVRFTTATALINELAEAAHANQLSRALGRWERLDLICIDELGYVPLAETACELMFQVIADRAEKAAVIVTTNLPFSEWSQVIPNPRLCKALIDRLTDRAHIITTGSDSYRFRRTTAQRKGSKS
jgi:DNA replication protein DnaC